MKRVTREKTKSVTNLVRDAVEDLHGQIRHLGEGVCSEMEQHPPDLGVNTVEGHTWRRHGRKTNESDAPSAVPTALQDSEHGRHVHVQEADRHAVLPQVLWSSSLFIQVH